MKAGWGCWQRDGGSRSWASTILPIHLFPFPAGSSPFQSFAWARGLLPPLFLHPSPSVTASTSLDDGPDPLLPPPGIWEAPGFPLPVPALNPTRGSPVWPHSYLLSCGLQTCSGFPPPKHTLLFAVGLTSPPRRPSSLPSSPFPVCSKPGGFIPLSIQGPQVPGHPSPSPCPTTLGFSVSRPANPHYSLFPPPHLPAPRLPNFHITVPGLPGAGPPMPGSARSRRREEERQRETGGSRAGPCRRDSPASGSAPRPAPGPKPTLPHPPRTEGERPLRAAPLGWVGGAGDAEPAEPAGGLGERSQGAGDVPPARPHFEASAARRPSVSARPGGVRFCVRGPGGAKRGSARDGAPRWQPGTCTPRVPRARPALPGCAPRVWPGRGCGGGALSAVRRRGRQGVPLSGPRGSES